MPIYNFKCGHCGHVFDELVKLSDTDAKCPKCGKDATKQVSAPTGFRLDGDGWYKPSASVFGEKESK